MVWDKNQTLGSIPRNLFDDKVRENNTALETAVDAEHYFATGGVQHGRHKFGVGTEAIRNAIGDLTTGALWVATGLGSDAQLQVRWQDTAIPGDDWVTVALELLELRNVWTKPQETAYVFIPTGPAPTPDLSLGPAFVVQGDQTIAIGTPLNLPAAGNALSFTIEIVVTGAGLFPLSFSGQYRFPSGQAPTTTSATGISDRFNCIVDSTGLLIDCFPAMDMS
jgi:hypothetical protein